MKSYSYILPKLYSQKIKFFDQQSLKEICEAEGAEKIAQTLKEHGYLLESNPKDFIELAHQFEIATQKRIEKIISLSPKEAEKILRAIDVWDKTSSIILAVKIFESTGDIHKAMLALPWGRDEKLKQEIEQGIAVLGSSAPQLRTIFETYFEREVRESLIRALKVTEEGGGISAFQLGLLLELKEYLMKEISKLNSMRKREVLKILCDYLDSLFLTVSVNALRNEGNRIVSSILEKSRMCRLNGKEIIEAYQTNSLQQIYVKMIASMGGAFVKSEDAEMQMIRVLRKKIRKVAEIMYASYPFTPALPLATLLLINIEKMEIMKIFIEMSSGINCEEAIQKSSLQ
ncbi:MAG: hypothetical protein ACPLSO_02305 [Fervidicoccaceae archaeon]